MNVMIANYKYWNFYINYIIYKELFMGTDFEKLAKKYPLSFKYIDNKGYFVICRKIDNDGTYFISNFGDVTHYNRKK